MTKEIDPNLEALDPEEESNGYLKLLKKPGRQTFVIDTSRSPFAIRAKRFYLTWNRTNYLTLNCSGPAEEILSKFLRRITKKNPNLRRCLKSKAQTIVLAKILETGEEGILTLGDWGTQEDLREEMLFAYEEGNISEACFTVRGRTKKDTSGNEYTKIDVVTVKKECDDYISEIEMPYPVEPPIEAVRYYVEILKKLYSGESLNKEEVQEGYTEVFKKYQPETQMNSVEEIFGPENMDLITGEEVPNSYEEKPEEDRLKKLAVELEAMMKKKGVEFSEEDRRKMETELGIHEIIEDLKKQKPA